MDMIDIPTMSRLSGIKEDMLRSIKSRNPADFPPAAKGALLYDREIFLIWLAQRNAKPRYLDDDLVRFFLRRPYTTLEIRR